jgi:hypothetical protein
MAGERTDDWDDHENHGRSRNTQDRWIRAMIGFRTPARLILRLVA